MWVIQVPAFHIISRFDIVCRQAVTMKKKLAKEVFFQSLGYTKITASRPKFGIGEFQKERNRQMAESFRKLYKVLPCGTRDTSWWRKATFGEICSEQSSILPLEQLDCVDVLFQNQPAREAMVHFRRSTMNEKDTSSILTLSRLDAIMTSIVDRLQEASALTDEIYEENGGSEHNVKVKKGGRVPIESSRRFKTLLPTATANLLNEVLGAFRTHLSNDKYLLHFELSMGRIGDNITRLRNKQRQFTLAFKNPSNNNFCIALQQNTFTSVICGWISGVVDCIILHSPVIDGPFSSFNCDVPIDIIHESDDERDFNDLHVVENTNPASSLEDEEESDNEQYDNI